MKDWSGCDAFKTLHERRETKDGEMEERKEGRLLSIRKYLTVIKSVSSIVSVNIQGKDSKGYKVETLPRRQWNLKSTQDQFWKLQSNIFFLSFQVSYIKTPKQVDEFIEIQSSTGTWYQRWLVRITTTFKQVKGRKTIPHGLLSLGVQFLIASVHGILTPWLPHKKSVAICKGLESDCTFYADMCICKLPHCQPGLEMPLWSSR